MRVYELAKELKMSSKDLLKALADMGIEAKSHSASIDEKAVEAVRKRAKGKQPAPTRKEKAPASAPRQAEPAKAAPRQAEPVKAAPKKAEPVKAAPRHARAPAP
ncbi:MAG: translation initiation factor IF-2 N-terminal domain-containing protein, partial [Candidatus Aquicultorales bacterium]